MPPKGVPKQPSPWSNAELLENLTLALYETAKNAGGFSTAAKEGVEAFMKQQGHAITWEAIRCKRNCIAKDLPSFTPPPAPSTFKLHSPRSSYRISCAMGGRQVQRWNPTVHEDILIAIFQHVNLSTVNWSSIMNDMRGKGYTFTEGALRQHVQKLRKNRDMSALEGAAEDNGATPTKPAAANKRGGRGRKAVSKKNVREYSPVDDTEEKLQLKREASDDEDTLDVETPVKKQRIKREYMEEDNEGFGAELGEGYHAEAGEV
ncbi:hypothetical protein JDV02_006184 [Purpureocillium takamizusanense]|uniref:Uncharacterized protein n=1 Tax=Purpureocillium takamizusanense TaxID=2060973 RepID=A0A9Q8VCQ6_9HYPO|nr:uncharacterized protein JDV02_006184 [Purpureocillium takamizusanense]UNI20057.1 hypothetical protein JDV02_006184 [Purpureocillium takamizusanense]